MKQRKFIERVRSAIWWYVGDYISRHIDDDERYVRIRYFFYTGKILHLNPPVTFNEKLQWLKLFAHRPEYVEMADKYAVKSLVSKMIGEHYVVPCLGVWNTTDEIDFDTLPEKFVLKCNHNSGGGMVICKDKSSLDIEKARKGLDECLQRGYFLDGRDKQYRDIPRKIIADTFLDDGREGELQDYKWWCFNGIPTYMYMTNKGKDIYENFYDMDFNPVMIDHGFPRRQPEYAKPEAFELMKTLAAKLSQGLPFVRVDFFYVGGKVYFGEFTFFDWGGFQPFAGNWDKKLGELIVLPKLQ